MLIEPPEHIHRAAESFLLKGSNGKGVLLTHGLTGSLADLRPLAELLNARGYTVKGVRLPGHSTRPEYLARIRYSDWQQAMHNALDELSAEAREVYALGNSFGGNLMYHLAATRPASIQRILTIGTPIFLHNNTLNWFLLPALKRVKPFLKKRWWMLPPETQEQLLATGTYAVTPLHAVHEMMRFIRDFTKQELPRVTAPTRILHARRDVVVPEKSARYIYAHLGSLSKELHWLSTYHNPFISFDEALLADIAAFFDKGLY